VASGSDLLMNCLGIDIRHNCPDDSGRPGKPTDEEFSQQGSGNSVLGEELPQSAMVNAAHVSSHGLVIAHVGGESQPRRKSTSTIAKPRISSCAWDKPACVQRLLH
jgi:hypothetical protein